jgi:4-hydroxybenzoate polyprenyltransferase
MNLEPESGNHIKGLINSIRNYLSLVKFSHTVFAMPFALIGFTLAVSEEDYHFSARLLLLVVLCMVFARNAAMGFNRLADKKYDSLNPRTEKREIPAGKIGTRAAALFVVVNSLMFIITSGFINKLTLILSPVAVLIILGYSLTKRFTFLCHFILGLGLSLAPIGAYISVTGIFNILPILYSLIVLTWVSGFDIIYALQDYEFDKKHRLHSIPSFSGRKKALLFSVLVHFISFFLIVAAGIAGKGNILYWIGALVFASLLIWQHSIVKPDDLSRVTLAFQTTNGIASVIYASFVILDLILF